jgi:hypothetical protein
MSRATRRQKSEAQLRSLEAQFSTNLVAALRECAGGTWGMFGRNDGFIAVQGRTTPKMSRSKTAEELLATGEEIERLRTELGITESYPHFKRFLEYRQMKGSNVPGEPKLAVQFLEKLGTVWMNHQTFRND